MNMDKKEFHTKQNNILIEELSKEDNIEILKKKFFKNFISKKICRCIFSFW